MSVPLGKPAFSVTLVHDRTIPTGSEGDTSSSGGSPQARTKRLRDREGIQPDKAEKPPAGPPGICQLYNAPDFIIDIPPDFRKPADRKNE
ncbi:hypothetical protein CHS0354_018536 [Potamilus streckersoni]|uniref:Uncharacterized protein n=1 Tax=Potamilus streckersoni TaxID=2493646 RepID=A0AAE0TBS2_9BIVA|nr:hypothetical protein CHS0354_018536 [Potamilus streckersoni]